MTPDDMQNPYEWFGGEGAGFLTTNKPLRSAAANTAAGIALILVALGQVITFVPGRETGWFVLSSALAAVGLLSPDWRVRTVAALLFLGAAWMAWAGYLHGSEYQEFLRNRNRP